MNSREDGSVFNWSRSSLYRKTRCRNFSPTGQACETRHVPSTPPVATLQRCRAPHRTQRTLEPRTPHLPAIVGRGRGRNHASPFQTISHTHTKALIDQWSAQTHAGITAYAANLFDFDWPGQIMLMEKSCSSRVWLQLLGKSTAATCVSRCPRALRAKRELKNSGTCSVRMECGNTVHTVS